MMICETGVGEGFSKPRFVNSVYWNVKTIYSEIRGLAWWSMQWTSPLGHSADTRITSSKKALDALIENLNDDYF